MNLHPPFSAFPTALFTVAFLFEITGQIKQHESIIKLARANLMLACLFMFFAYFSGLYAADNASISFVVPTEAIKTHHNIGKLLLILCIPTGILSYISYQAKSNKKLFTAIFHLTLASCFLLAIYCGWLGGKLVFKHGAGVQIDGISAEK